MVKFSYLSLVIIFLCLSSSCDDDSITQILSCQQDSNADFSAFLYSPLQAGSSNMTVRDNIEEALMEECFGNITRRDNIEDFPREALAEAITIGYSEANQTLLSEARSIITREISDPELVITEFVDASVNSNSVNVYLNFDPAIEQPCTAVFETVFTGLARNNGGANTDPSIPGFSLTIATGFVQEDQVPLTIQGVGFDITGALLRVGDIRESEVINGVSYRLEVTEISINQSDMTTSFVRYTLDRKDCATSCAATFQTVFTGLARNNGGANTDPSVPGFELTIGTGLDTEGIQGSDYHYGSWFRYNWCVVTSW